LLVVRCLTAFVLGHWGLDAVEAADGVDRLPPVSG